MRVTQFVLVLCAVAVANARYAPTRDHDKDWLSLVSGQQQLRDARIIYTLLNNDPEFMKKRGRSRNQPSSGNEEDSATLLSPHLSHSPEKQGFDSNEGDFDGFQHPFYYVSHQKQHVQQREPFVFSRIGANGPLEPERAVVVDLPFRLGRLAEEMAEGDHLGTHLTHQVPAEV